MQQRTLVILNPKAGGGRAGKIWAKLEPLMYEQLGDLVVAITETPSQVGEHLDEALSAGLTQIISVGGDGTNHAIVNALMKRENGGKEFVLGQLPVGTGQDFARTLGMPRDPEAAIRWLANAKPHPVDVGRVDYGGKHRYFLNIASAGISGDVDQRIDRAKRYPWTFWLGSIVSLLRYKPPVLRIRCDGEEWYTGSAWMVAVANGAQFGRGMLVAPDARIDDGLLDVVLIKDTPRLKAIRLMNTLYSGTHLTLDEVEMRHSQEVEIEPLEDVNIPLDLDGEPDTGKPVHFRIQTGALRMLRQP